MINLNKDNLYTQPLANPSAFEFDAAVVQVFPDMIQRSVPGYQTIITAIGLLAARFTPKYGVCYDLGCSLGAVSLSMQKQLDSSCKIIAVDNSPAMIEKLKPAITSKHQQAKIELIHADIRDIEIHNASVVVLNFTLQFIPINDRLKFLQKIYQGLSAGGILILSEKLCFENPQQQRLHTEMHHLFKQAQGYSAMEISQKRSALENVLIPETLFQHQQRLYTAGFNSSEVWFQYFNFASMIALK